MTHHPIRSTCQLLACCLAVLLSPLTIRATAHAATPPSKIVFAAYRDSLNTSRTKITTEQDIFVINPDGTGLSELTFPSDGHWYDYPQWALGGTKIVYVRRSSAYSTDDNIWIMNANGSDQVQLTHDLIPKGQPKLTTDGKTLIFTAGWREFPKSAIYALHLDTGLITNLTAVHSPTGGNDADPKITPDGKHIIYVSRGANSRYGQVFEMRIDGSHAHQVFADRWLDTDPMMSPDSKYIVTSSYVESSSPLSNDQITNVKRSGWVLERIDPKAHVAVPLTHNKDCSLAFTPCAPNDGTAFVPVWSPDGSEVAFLSVRGLGLGGIYAVSRDGMSSRVLFESFDLRISWFDWEYMTGTTITLPPPPPDPGIVAFSAQFNPGLPGSTFGPSQIYITGPDRWASVQVTDDKRWYSNVRLSPDRTFIIATVRPSGKDYLEEHLVRIDLASGLITQLTSGPYRDTAAAIAPDGKSIYFTRYALDGSDSAIMRMNLDGSHLTNLSDVSAEGQPTADSHPSISPDGATIAFTTLVGDTAQIAIMGSDGFAPQILTNDLGNDSDPAWSPDGQLLAYINHSPTSNGTSPSYALVLFQPGTGYYWILTTNHQYIGSPVFSPDGKRILYIASGPSGTYDIFSIDTNGSNKTIVEPTLLSNEIDLDWR